MKVKTISLGVSLILGVFILGYSLNAGAEKNEEKAFMTSKSDRTLIKEIHTSQREILRLLREIKKNGLNQLK